jgi:HlyD family secretion protein
MDDQAGTLPVQRVPSPAAQPAPKAGRHGLRARRSWLVIAVLLIAAAAGAVWWETRPAPPIRYVTAPVTRGTVARTVTSTGTVNPENTIIVGTYVSGVIQELYCDYNTQVKAGQICAKIDPRPYQATLDQYSGQLLRDQAILDKDRVNLTRYQKLATENSIARQQAEDQQQIVHQDEGTVKIDQALVDGAKFNLGYTDIVSPVDGTVVSRNVSQGQTVAASFQTPTLFLIATDLTKMQVDTNVSESDIGGIKTGDTATFVVDAYPQRTFKGTVTQVRQSPQTVQNVVTFDSVISVANADLALMPGMTASTRIIVNQRDDVIRVPNQALRFVPTGVARPPSAPANASGGAYVWVLRDGQPVSLAVTPGIDDDNFTEIVSGDIKAGDQVITGEQRDATAPGSALPLPRF